MLTLRDPMDSRQPGSSVRGILQARILEWVAIPFSRGPFQPRHQTQVSRIASRSDPPGQPTGISQTLTRLCGPHHDLLFSPVPAHLGISSLWSFPFPSPQKEKELRPIQALWQLRANGIRNEKIHVHLLAISYMKFRTWVPPQVLWFCLHIKKKKLWIILTSQIRVIT